MDFSAISALFKGFAGIAILLRTTYSLKKIPLILQLELLMLMGNENLLSVQHYPQLSATYGIKESSCFSKLQHFPVVHGFPPDLVHDILEEFAIDLTTN